MICYGHGVCLCPVDSDDLEIMRLWRNSPEIWIFCRQHDLISDAMQQRWFEKQDNDPTCSMYVVHTDAGRVGVCGLTGIDRTNRVAELSLYIAPDFQKKGLGEKTFRTLISHGFRNLGLNSIFCEVFHGNPVSRIVEKVGFQKWGTKPQSYFRDGRFIDSDFFSILASAWNG